MAWAGVENIQRKRLKLEGEGCTKPGPASHNSSNSHSLNALAFRLPAAAAAAQYRWKEIERKLSPLGGSISQHSQNLQYFIQAFVDLLLKPRS